MFVCVGGGGGCNIGEYVIKLINVFIHVIISYSTIYHGSE